VSLCVNFITKASNDSNIKYSHNYRLGITCVKRESNYHTRKTTIITCILMYVELKNFIINYISSNVSISKHSNFFIPSNPLF